MFEIVGKYNSAKVFADLVESEAQSQIMDMCNIKEFKDNKIRIMPDVHAGKGCTIGTTMTINGRIIPDMVGVDIGCGMLWGKIDAKDLDLYAFHLTVSDNIPAGTNVNKDMPDGLFDLESLRCHRALKKKERVYKSIGSLGGGNHFIEVDKSDDGTLYLVIHSGSRNLGKQVAEYYMREGVEAMRMRNSNELKDIIDSCKAAGLEKQINDKVKECLEEQTLSKWGIIESSLFDDYIHDMKLVQEFARINRDMIMDTICKKAGISVTDRIHTVHNYIDTDSMIMRKGAVSAKEGERLLIPLNMRDGSLICVGKGNPDWNYSAPHGAGRLFSRSKTKEIFDVPTFKDVMEGVYSKTVGSSTLDECPMAYKPYKTIMNGIGDTVEVVERIKSIYNFKAS